MPLDALLIHHLKNELSFLEGARIDRIFMPTYEDVVFFIRAGDKNVKLLISCSSATPRCGLVEKTGENPDTPFAFLMHLRKHLTGGVIRRVSQVPYERVLKIDVTSSNNMFSSKDYVLYVELVGKFSNIILTENGRISDSAKHLPLDVTTRAVLPGLNYSLPPAQTGKTDIGTRDFFIEKTVRGYQGAGLKNYLQKNFIGFAPASIKEAVFRSSIDDDCDKINPEDAGRIYDAFLSLIDDYRPALLESDEKFTGFYPSPYGCEQGKYILFPSISSALEKYYDDRLDIMQISSRGKKLYQIVKQQLDHCANNSVIFESRLKENDDCEQERMLGDLIVSNIYRIKPGDTIVLVDDYFSGDKRKITLDPHLSPAKNAAMHYKKYEKAKSTKTTTMQLLQKNKERQDYLESILVSLKCAVTNNDLDEIEREMTAEKLIKAPRNRQKSNKQSVPIQLNVDGFRVIIGKNNYQNDAIVKNSQKNYLWLHTQKIHGSHAVIEAADVPQETINKVAAFCAYYSKASDSANVPVDYTLIKYVKKPSGAAPGKVIYTNQQTVNVTPRRPDSSIWISKR